MKNVEYKDLLWSNGNTVQAKTLDLVVVVVVSSIILFVSISFTVLRKAIIVVSPTYEQRSRLTGVVLTWSVISCCVLTMNSSELG